MNTKRSQAEGHTSKAKRDDPNPKDIAAGVEQFRAKMAARETRREAELGSVRAGGYSSPFEVANPFEFKSCREEVESTLYSLLSRCEDLTVSAESLAALDNALIHIYKNTTQGLVAEFFTNASGQDLVWLAVLINYWESLRSDLPGMKNHLLLATQRMLEDGLSARDVEAEKENLISLHRFSAALPIHEG